MISRLKLIHMIKSQQKFYKLYILLVLQPKNSNPTCFEAQFKSIQGAICMIQHIRLQKKQILMCTEQVAS